ncbi:hypothetical protein ABK040_011060 [Willaertia magna]
MNERTNKPYVVGIDVGSTTTDIALVEISTGSVKTSFKSATTLDITEGILNGIEKVILDGNINPSNDVACFIIGTTHFINALISFSTSLEKVAVIRLSGSAFSAFPPFEGFPNELKEIVEGDFIIINGGYEVDGRLIQEVSEEDVIKACTKWKEQGLNNIVISGIFSPLNVEQEEKVAEWVREIYKEDNIEVKITCSHNISQLGLIQRENASILNASLKQIASEICYGFQQSIGLRFGCPFFLTQNDGTIITPSTVVEYPIFTIQSGPTNSMRGAAFLTKLKDAIVVDIGGLTTDVGVLQNGFPRLSNNHIPIGGVVTNFRVPDVYSVGLGGGSIVNHSPEVENIVIGPKSVGYKIRELSKIFGGEIFTATDAAVACGLSNFGKDEKTIMGVKDELKEVAPKVLKQIRTIVEEAIDKMKTSSKDVPVILVGGGSVLIDCDTQKLGGASTVIKPNHYECANAVGAALSQISATIDKVVSVERSGKTKQQIGEEIKEEAVQKAITFGAVRDSVEIFTFEIIPLAYIPGDTCRYICKAVGNLDLQCVDKLLDQQQVIKPKQSIPKVAKPKEKLNNGSSNEINSAPIITYENDRPVWNLTVHDLNCIEIGSGIISTGGGGNPKLMAMVARSLLSKGKSIKIIRPEDLKEDDCVVILALMGAPLVLQEKILTTEFVTGIQTMEKITHKKITAIMCAEIGGSNSITPLIVSSLSGLPVIDADGMGRAFPELQMISTSIYGCDIVPVLLVDDKNTQVCVYSSNSGNIKSVESYMRKVVVEMGSVGALLMSPLSKEQILKVVVRNSFSEVYNIGKRVLYAKQNSLNPITSILSNQTEGKLLFSGKIVNVERNSTTGFTVGNCVIAGLMGTEYENKQCTIEFQNEFLVAKVGDENQQTIVASVPDIISIIDTQTGISVQTEELSYGFRVSVLYLPSHELMCTPKALGVVGPAAFGYNIEFSPLKRQHQFTSIFDKTSQVQ